MESISLYHSEMVWAPTSCPIGAIEQLTNGCSGLFLLGKSASYDKMSDDKSKNENVLHVFTNLSTQTEKVPIRWPSVSFPHPPHTPQCSKAAVAAPHALVPPRHTRLLTTQTRSLLLLKHMWCYKLKCQRQVIHASTASVSLLLSCRTQARHTNKNKTQ